MYHGLNLNLGTSFDDRRTTHLGPAPILGVLAAV
jgi:hypothetical protein